MIAKRLVGENDEWQSMIVPWVVSDNRRFWKTVGCLFLVRTLPTESIILNNKNESISNIKDVKEVSWMSHNVSFCIFFL